MVDAVTVAWLKRNFDPVFGFSSLIRFSWSTAKQHIEKSNGVAVNWYVLTCAQLVENYHLCACVHCCLGATSLVMKMKMVELWLQIWLISLQLQVRSRNKDIASSLIAIFQ